MCSLLLLQDYNNYFLPNYLLLEEECIEYHIIHIHIWVLYLMLDAYHYYYMLGSVT